MIKTQFDPLNKVKPFHQGAVMTHTLTPGYSAQARALVASGIDLANIHAMRHADIQALYEAGGERSQVPVTPDGIGYLSIMKRPSLDATPIQLNHVLLRK